MYSLDRVKLAKNVLLLFSPLMNNFEKSIINVSFDFIENRSI